MFKKILYFQGKGMDIVFLFFYHIGYCVAHPFGINRQVYFEIWQFHFFDKSSFFWLNGFVTHGMQIIMPLSW